MRCLLCVLLLTSHVTVFFGVTSSQSIETNDIKESDGDNPAQAMEKMARSVELIAKTMSRVMSDDGALKIDVKSTTLDDGSLPSIQANGWYCSPPFIKHGSICLLAECSTAPWTKAQQTCATKGGDLIWLDSASEHLKANEFFSKSCTSSSSYYWTAMRWNQNGKFARGDLEEDGYTSARILNVNKPKFASNSLAKELRGRSLISRLPFLCRQDPKIGKDIFQGIKMKDIDITAVGISLGPLDLLKCKTACANRGSSCVAFHRSLAGVCFVIEKANTESWKMTAGIPLSSYYVKARNLAPKCSSLKFPITHGGSRYRFEIAKKSWHDARQNCESLGGKLVELTTELERSFINDDRRTVRGFPQGPKCAQIGMKQKPGASEPRGGWTWYPSGLPVNMNRRVWNRGQPDNHKSLEHLGCLRTEGGLNDIDAKTPLSSICECSIIT